jgi:hypothetical protein
VSREYPHESQQHQAAQKNCVESLYRFAERMSSKGADGAQYQRRGLLAWLLNTQTADLRVIKADLFENDSARKSWKANTSTAAKNAALLVLNQAEPELANIVSVKLYGADDRLIKFHEALPLETGDAHLLSLVDGTSRVVVEFRKTPKSRGAGLAVSKAEWSLGASKAAADVAPDKPKPKVSSAAKGEAVPAKSNAAKAKPVKSKKSSKAEEEIVEEEEVIEDEVEDGEETEIEGEEEEEEDD